MSSVFKYRFVVLMLVFGFFSLFCEAVSQDAGDEWHQTFVTHDAMGMAIMARCGATEESFHYGYRDFERQLPLNENTLFRIASVSKTVTAMAALYLSDSGLLDLDKPLGEILNFNPANPLFPGVDITTKMLLTHTSSIQDGSGYSDFLWDSYTLESPPILSELLLPGGDYFTDNMWRLEEPATFFMYSNLNYGLVASVIEKVTETRFDNFMKDTFLPLLDVPGGYNPAQIENINDVAVLYRKPGGQWVPQADQFWGEQPDERELTNYKPGNNGLIFAPQGGLRTTSKGLSKVAELLLNDGIIDDTLILSEESLQLLMQPQWEFANGNGDTYFNLFYAFGAGTHITTNRPGADIVIDGHAFIGHPGAAYGLVSNLYVQPEKNAYIIFLTNGVGAGLTFDNRSSFYSIENDVFDTFETHIFDVCEEDNNGTDTSHLNEYIPSEIKILNAYPNPFNSTAVIQYTLPESSEVSIRLYNLTGRNVFTNNIGFKNPGKHFTTIHGTGLSSGAYIVRLQTGNGRDSQMLYLIK